jgi:hypothetical protein
MAKRTTPALFYGEYVQPHSARSETVVLARNELMKVCNRVYPEFLKSLRDSVFPAYSNVARKNLKRIGRRRDTYPRPLTPEHAKICQLLDEWMRKFNAEAEWLFEGALQTMRFWFDNVIAGGEWATKPVAKRELRVGDAFAFTAPAWRPQQEKWESYRALIQGSLEKALRTYQTDTRAQAEALGLGVV